MYFKLLMKYLFHCIHRMARLALLPGETDKVGADTETGTRASGYC